MGSCCGGLPATIKTKCNIHLFSEIVLQLRQEKDQHDDAADDGHCGETEEKSTLAFIFWKNIRSYDDNVSLHLQLELSHMFDAQ